MLVLLLRRKYGRPYVDVYSRKGREFTCGGYHLSMYLRSEVISCYDEFHQILECKSKER